MRHASRITGATFFEIAVVLLLVLDVILETMAVQTCLLTCRPHLYGLGHPRQLSPQVTLAAVTAFSLFLSKIYITFTLRLHYERELVSGAETTRVGELSHLGR